MNSGGESDIPAESQSSAESGLARGLPAGWAVAKIGDLCAINPGFEEPPEPDTDVSFVPMRAVSDEVGEITAPEVRPYHQVSRGYTQFADGDVIMAKITPSMENGKSAVASALTGGIGCGSTEFFVLRPRGAITPEYLHRFLRQVSFRREARAAMRGAGGHGRVPQNFLENTVIPVPPLNEQRRIVARLRELETPSRRARKQLAEIPRDIDDSRHALLASAFSGALTADWRRSNKSAPPREWTERIHRSRQHDWEENEAIRRQRKGQDTTDSAWKKRYRPPMPLERGRADAVPRTWAYVSAEACAWEVTVGYVGTMRSQYVNSGIPFLRSQNVRANRFDPTDLVFISRSFHERLAKSALHPGDVVIVRTGAPGTSCVIPDDLQEANCSDLVIARPISSILSKYLSLYLNSPTAREQIFDLRVGIAQQHFNVRAMARVGVPVAPPAEQRMIVERVESALAQFDKALVAHAAATTELEAVEQSLLARAFQGELVEQTALDEPAANAIARFAARKQNHQPRKRMRKRQQTSVTSERRPLVAVLRAVKHSMSPEELFRESGRDEMALDDVESFYAELRNLTKSGDVVEERPDSASVRLTAKP
jgi:type I restriction enzyme S subunit